MSFSEQPNDSRIFDARLQPGLTVGGGRFTLSQQLGRGGMGIVWQAHDSYLNEYVALKFLPAEVRADPVALDDMRRETAKSRRLTHPNIIRIHEFYRLEDEAFVSMEYIDGPNLNALRLQQPHRVFQWGYLAPLVQQLCSALEYAHSERTIHRDLKPANMMLDSRGRLKLADFGIAAVVDEAAGRISVKHTTGGTMAYMSPQQMDGQPPRVTDDIYALGATLYELLTSKPPFFSGDIPHQVRTLPAAPIHERLEELLIANEVPEAVAAMIMACLAKEPEKRPQSAAAVADWLGLEVAPRSTYFEAQEEAPDQTTWGETSTEKKRGWFMSLVGGGIMVLLIGEVWYATIYSPQHASKQKDEVLASSRNASANPAPRIEAPSLPYTLSNMVWIPPGTFRMGTPEGDPEIAALEAPQTPVTISKGFWLGKYEVTQREFRALMTNNPARFTNDLNQPIERVSWEDACKYCGLLSQREATASRLPAGYLYRLPTEAEWEYAARAGTTNAFSFGNDPAELPDYGWFAANSGHTTHPVGQKNPNPWGLYDMHGNVWEWCLDWRATYTGFEETDPIGPIHGSVRVTRGGGWADNARECRSANRFNFVVIGPKGVEFVGFRVALAPPTTPAR